VDLVSVIGAKKILYEEVLSYHCLGCKYRRLDSFHRPVCSNLQKGGSGQRSDNKRVEQGHSKEKPLLSLRRRHRANRGERKE